MRTELRSLVEIWRPGQRGAKWRWKGQEFCVMGTVNSHFL